MNILPKLISNHFPYTTLFRSLAPQTICRSPLPSATRQTESLSAFGCFSLARICATTMPSNSPRSEEHTSELQSHLNLVCRLLLENKNTFTTQAQNESEY